MKNKKVELLSPAGNVEGFYGAINAGADAVYLAGEKYGARAYAENFTEETLVSCIELAHLYGKKVYMAVNTLLKEQEISQLPGYIKPFYEAGLDGVIIQDLGVADVLKTNFPELELHASTQMTLTNQYSLEFLKKKGFSRVVPSRELSLKEIRSIKKHTQLELECFIHGAMCYCYSGQCLFSSVLGGRSGNRGRCAQPCRLPYKVLGTDRKESDVCYPLSMKDQITAQIIPQLIEAGIDSFKIEGRMKKPEYSAGVTAVYRRIIDNYYGNRKTIVNENDLKVLTKLYLRSDKQEGYYHTYNGKEMITVEKPSYNAVEDSLLDDIRQKYIHYPKNLGITGYLCLAKGCVASLTLQYGEVSAAASGEMVEEAQNHALSKDDALKQIRKIGDTAFYFEELDAWVDEGVFCSVKGLNQLRRDAIAGLKGEILKANGFKKRNIQPQKNEHELKQHSMMAHDDREGYAVSVMSREQLEGVLVSQLPIEVLYLDYDLFLKLEDKEIKEISKYRKIRISLPPVFREKSEPLLEKIMKKYEQFDACLCGMEVMNLEELQWLSNRNFKDEITTGDSLYCYNSYAVRAFEETSGTIVLPLEQTRKECLKLLESCDKTDYHNYEKIVYGRTRMMLSANCVEKTTHGCKGNTKTRKMCSLIDRTNTKFPVVLDCNLCCNSIYNSVPLCIWEKLEAYRKGSRLKLVFTVENEAETKQVLDYYKMNCREKPDFKYTTCFEKRETE